MTLLLPLRSSYMKMITKPNSHNLYKPKFIIISQDSSKPTIEQSSSNIKPISPGQGFGSGSTQIPKSKPNPDPSKKKQKGSKKERASIIRRSPVGTPSFLDKEEKEEEEKIKSTNESENAFLITWLCLGCLILVEGIALAASGFLPEEWDKFLVKFLYPSFTPTVFLFVVGTVVYGVLKYLQNDSLRNQK